MTQVTETPLTHAERMALIYAPFDPWDKLTGKSWGGSKPTTYRGPLTEQVKNVGGRYGRDRKFPTLSQLDGERQS